MVASPTIILKKEVNKKILIVDDEDFNIEALMIILQYNIGIQNIDLVCEKALNGDSAIHKIMTHVERNGFSCYDFILMDCNMPIMDGYTAT